MKRFAPIIILLVFIVSCGRHGNTDGNKADIIVLNETNLFNVDSVALFLSNASSNQSDSSKKFFLNAIDIFKNNNNAERSISVFLESLMIYPTASAYYELGDAFLEAGKPSSALKSFQMAERLDYSPFGNVLFKEAAAYAELGDDKTKEYLKYAIENGFVDRDKIFNNKSFAKYDASYPWIENVFNEAMAGNGDADAILWQGYSRQFLPASFPIVIDSGTFKSMDHPVTINYDYDKYITEMRDGKFSRDVGNEFYYFAKVADTASYKTVIYVESPYEENGGPAYYYMASFNNLGRLIDKKMIAGAKTFTDLYKVFNMPTSREFNIQEYKNTYEKNTDKDGFEDNPVIKRDLVKTTSYTIDSTGRFMELLSH